MTGILGESQTFVGVLATVVVLFILANESNFIYHVLKGLIEGCQKKVEEMQANLELQMKGAFQAIKYKDFEEEQIMAAAEDVLSANWDKFMKISAKAVDIQTRYSKGTLSPILKRLDEIKDAKETVMAPLFTFAFCILVFIVDEIVTFFPGCVDNAVTFLTVVMIWSAVYWSWIWFRSYKEWPEKYMPKPSEYFCMPGVVAVVEEDDERIRYFSQPFFEILILLGASAFFYMILICATGLVSPSSTVIVAIILGIIITGPAIVTGYWHAFSCECRGQYRHSFLFAHFVGICGLALITVLVLNIPILGISDVRIPYKENLWVLKSCIIGFTLVFGLILPFFVPYLCYRRNYMNARTESKGTEHKMEDDFSELRAMIEAL